MLFGNLLKSLKNLSLQVFQRLYLESIIISVVYDETLNFEPGGVPHGTFNSRGFKEKGKRVRK